MTVEIRPLGVTCNLRCVYCYQHPQREIPWPLPAFDLEAIKRRIEAQGCAFTVFGGEPLLVPLTDLEALWSWGFTRFGQNGVQTNGTLISAEHIRLFKQYRVHVGISIDGPETLNEARWAGSAERTRQTTATSEGAILRLCQEGIPPSLIVTLHRANATTEHLETLCDWFRKLDTLGVTSCRLHIMEADSVEARERYGLTTEENLTAFRRLRRAERELPHLHFDVFQEMREVMLGHDNPCTCIWGACDPYTTRAVCGIEGQGMRSNCGRTNKDGIDWAKSDTPGFERYLALYATPQEHGGCRGCRFFLACKGQCPGTAIDGDWRNRSEYCPVWKGLLRDYEEELLDAGQTPISGHPQRIALEQAFLAALVAGDNNGVAPLLSKLENSTKATDATEQHNDMAHGDAHGDHTDGAGARPARQGHGDHIDRVPPTRGRGDATHGDAHADHHGDHTDAANIREV